MDRKSFIKNCSFVCLGTASAGILLQSCVSSKTITSPIENDSIIVSLSEFIKEKNGKMQFLNYVVVHNEKLAYPIYVFRFSENDYSALYLRCTHQGNELNVYGEKLVCSAHGSEFDNRGKLTNGPATEPLKSFPIRITLQDILISLKSIG